MTLHRPIAIRLRYNCYVQLVATKRGRMRVPNLKFWSPRQRGGGGKLVVHRAVSPLLLQPLCYLPSFPGTPSFPSRPHLTLFAIPLLSRSLQYPVVCPIHNSRFITYVLLQKSPVNDITPPDGVLISSSNFCSHLSAGKASECH